ncbi:Uncharacterised protein [Mycobacterium tuberculosis]|nr:Uncharacterised protein [Mycobacterium tuberculosis]
MATRTTSISPSSESTDLTASAAAPPTPPAITTTSARLSWPSTISPSSVGSLLTMPTRFTSAQASRPAAAKA